MHRPDIGGSSFPRGAAVALLTVATASAGLVGCDDPRPAVPTPPLPVATTAPAVAIEPQRPTTQALLSGPRTRTVLAPLPLALQLPQGWTLETIADTPVLNGPAPSGDLTVSLITRAVSTKAIELTERGAKEEADARPGVHLLAAARTVNGVRIFERQSVGTTIAPDGSPTFRWHITVYAPASADSEFTTTYELNFLGLSRAAFEADKPFLTSIIDSIELTSR
jgi:hypothetical protein